jgi:hypothetical protein
MNLVKNNTKATKVSYQGPNMPESLSGDMGREFFETKNGGGE